MSDSGKDDVNMDPQGASQEPSDQPQAADLAAREALLYHGVQQPQKKKRGINPMGPLAMFLLVGFFVVAFFAVGPETILSSWSDEEEIPAPTASQVDETVSRLPNTNTVSELDFDPSPKTTQEPEFQFIDVETFDEPATPKIDTLDVDVFEDRIASLEELIARLASSQPQGISPEQLERVLEENTERVSSALQKQLDRSEKERERILTESSKRTEALEARLAAEAERAAKEREAATARITAAQNAARERAEAEREAAAQRIAAAQEAARQRAEAERKAAAERIAAAEEAAMTARAAAAAAAAAANRPAANASNQQNSGDQAAKKAAEDAAKLEARKRASPTLVLDMGAENANDGPSSVAGTSIGTADDVFLAQNAKQSVVTAVSNSIPDPSSTIVQGTIISGVLESAVSSELPGTLRAQVIEPVFSFDGNRILMPAGTTLIGSYRNKVVIGQSRLLVAWNRAITPQGQSISLGSIGTDTLGRSGSRANVNNRLGQKIAMAALISTIAIAPEIAAARLIQETGTEVNLSSGDDDSESAIDEVGGAVADELGDFLGKYLDMPPLLRIAQGEEIRVLVNRDLVFR